MIAISTARHNGRTICTSSAIVRTGDAEQSPRRPLLPHTLAILRAQAAKRQPIGLPSK